MRKFVIKVNGNQYEVEVEEVVNGAQPVQSPSLQTAVPAAAPIAASKQAEISKQTAPKAASAATPEGAQKVTSPMPGTILKINVTEGETIKKGQVLLILEAMKMENEIVSPRDAVIGSVNVTKGASVSAGDLLVSLV